MTANDAPGREHPELDEAERPDEITLRWRQVRRALRVLVAVAAFCVCVPTLLASFGCVHWAFDLFSHFRVQYLLVLTACAVVLVLLRGWWWLLVPAVGLAVNAIEIVPWYFGKAAAPRASESGEGVPSGGQARTLTVLSANVWNYNEHHERLLDLISARDPDVVVVVEATPEWTSALEAIEGAYPYCEMYTRHDPFGIAVYSKRPLEEARIVMYGSIGLPSIVASVHVGGKAVTLIATHPIPPRGRRNWRLRNEQLEAIAAARDEFGERLIIAGDFNASPFSPCMKRFVGSMAVADSRLRYASKGYGIKPTWPTFNRLFYTPIDHILVTDNLVVTDFRTGPQIGSDHLPIQATIVVGD